MDWLSSLISSSLLAIVVCEWLLKDGLLETLETVPHKKAGLMCMIGAKPRPRALARGYAPEALSRMVATAGYPTIAGWIFVGDTESLNSFS